MKYNISNTEPNNDIMNYLIYTELLYKFLVILLLSLMSILLWRADLYQQEFVNIGYDINDSLNNINIEIEYEDNY